MTGGAWLASPGWGGLLVGLWLLIGSTVALAGDLWFGRPDWEALVREARLESTDLEVRLGCSTQRLTLEVQSGGSSLRFCLEA